MKKSSVGIDMTAKDLKMVCLSPKGENHLLIDHALLQRSDMENIKKMVENPVISKGIKRLSIHDEGIKIRKITVPVVPKEELEELIRWTFKDTIKAPIEDLTIRYYPIGGEVEKQQSYLVLALEKKRLQDHLIELQKTGIPHPELIEPSVQALANCINYNCDLKDTDRYANIHLDALISHCTIVSSEGILFYRIFSHTNESNGDDIQNFFSKLAIEIQYSCENYNTQFPDQPITHAILSGEKTNLPGLREHIEETLHIPTNMLEVFKKIEVSEEQQRALANIEMQYCIAVGLAL